MGMIGKKRGSWIQIYHWLQYEFDANLVYVRSYINQQPKQDSERMDKVKTPFRTMIHKT